MTSPEPPVAVTVPERLVRRAGELAAAGGRRVLGITGPPGAGKSTLAEALASTLEADRPGSVVVVGMDGFHLRQEALVELGREHRKGAPDTFDVQAYIALLQRIRQAERDVLAPAFDRVVDDPVPDRILIPASVPLVITEGNYLLLPEPGWTTVAELLDETWYVDIPDQVRLGQLTRRHVEFGMDEPAARAWAEGTDQRNAEKVQNARERADLIITDFGADPAGSDPAAARVAMPEA
ncbi:MAG: nucleoside/nucleotide kinase family protein [Propionicimonas sp.]